MFKLWLVAAQEYKRHVLNKSFIFAVLSVPLLIASTLGLGMLTERMRSGNRPFGYVDPSGWILPAVFESVGAGGRSELRLGEARLGFQAFESEGTAQAALDGGAIQAYFVLAADFAQSHRVDLVYLRPPGEGAMSQFWDFLRLARLAHEESSGDWPVSRALVERRVIEGDHVIVRSADGLRVYDKTTPFSFLLPLFIGLGFIILFISTATTLAQAFAEEKEDRTIEVMATSVAPRQIVVGKVMGITAMGLTELAAWLVLSAVPVGLVSQVAGWEWLSRVHLHPRTAATLILVAIPSYVLFAGLMVALGNSVADAQESQQVGGVLSLVFMLPIYAIQAMVEQSSGPLAVGLSLFPLTSLVSYCLLTGFSSVPLWQISASVAILVLSAAGAVWLAAQAFRLGMLRYGQRVDWRELLGVSNRTRPSLPAERRQP
ncbi:MAG: ABC-2 family transporter protein [Chloroflexi bacterium ADurb.Bin180]|nr:MAG: ABC-2 family transporter protein [Chloroflexi bacterium ADurb.Bin180]